MVAVKEVTGLKVHICAWCGCTMQNGYPVEYHGNISELDSHGICHGCSEKYFGEALAGVQAEVEFSLSVEGVRA